MGGRDRMQDEARAHRSRDPTPRGNRTIAKRHDRSPGSDLPAFFFGPAHPVRLPGPAAGRPRA
eukprot:9471539-Pyramimonas_sp.AAC.1